MKEKSNAQPKEAGSEKKINRRTALKYLATFAAGVLAEKAVSNEKRTQSVLKGMGKFLQRKTENISTEEPETLEDEKAIPEIKTDKRKEKFAYNPEEIANKVLEKYHEVFQKKDFLPKEIFTSNFFIATQLQESNFDPKAESHAGAVGIMQVMPITIKEVIRFLHHLDGKGEIDSFAAIGMEALTDSDIEVLIKLIKGNADYGRAFGKLYFADLYRLHKIGEKEYKKRDIKTAQKKLLACYNWVPKRFKRTPDNENNWPKESRDYYRKIFRNMNYLKRFQKGIAEKNIKSNSDYLSMRLVQAMNSYKKINDDSPIFDDLLSKYLSEIKYAEESRHRKLKDHEIDTVLDKLRAKIMISYLQRLEDPKISNKS